MTAQKDISLLPKEEDLTSTSARILHWATTVGRYIIVFTEFIVILAFISRFWLDRQNADLSELIRQQKAILESTQQFEKDFSLLKQRLEKIRTFYAKQPEYDKNILSLVKSTPAQIIYNNISLAKDQNNQVVVSATLSSLNEQAIIDFITNLILNKDIQKVTVENIEKKLKSSTYSISLSLLFKPKSAV